MFPTAIIETGVLHAAWGYIST